MISALLASVLVIAWMAIAMRRAQQRCDRLNAENDLRWEQWKALTPHDRAWLVANGATEPSLCYHELK